MQSSPNSNYHGQILQVAVPSPLRRTFDYLPPAAADPAQIQTGVRVLVPFGNRQLVGVLVAVATESQLEKNRLKAATAILDPNPLYNRSMQQVLSWAAQYYQHPIGEVYATALPGKLRTSKKLHDDLEIWQTGPEFTANSLAELSRAPKQKQLLELIIASVSATSEHCQQAGFSGQLLRELARKGLIVKQTTAAPAPAVSDCRWEAAANPVTLNKEQSAAVAEIEKHCDEFACFLLDGITGSGKTEVYIRTMQTQIARGRQCMILVPEIGLTPQTVKRFEQRFSCPVVSLHSGLTDTERLHAWQCAQDGRAGIIIGTRSAIFTPMANAGLIVVDEEHDSSFKQQDGFRYSARDLAIVRARSENINVILGSATPSLESLHNARSKKSTHLQLHKRAGQANTATIEIVDVASEQLTEGFSELLLYKIGKHLQQRNQVLVFINRRGFAPVLNCQSCGWSAECEHCIALLTVHSQPPAMRCHHCGNHHSIPQSCPQCHSKALTTAGMGTQKIESFLNKQFPDTPVLRIDRDSVRSKKSLQQKLAQVQTGEPCILLGTQMLAKGHHFPNITLAAIVDADVGLFSADFRGQEQMAQTIIQVAGRAGRADKPGEVLIQSRHAGHRTLQSLATGDYSVFAELLLEERLLTGMPPFAHLGLLRAEATTLSSALSYLQQAKDHATQVLEDFNWPVTLLGPLPAPMEKRAGRFRAQLLVKSSNRGALQELVTIVCRQLETHKQPSRLRWSVDIDPQDLI